MTATPALAPSPAPTDRLRITHGWEDAVRPDGYGWRQPVLNVEMPYPGAYAYATRPDGAILMIRMWRLVLGDFNWELPGGGGDPQDGDIVATATRELVEESGYVPPRPGRLLGMLHTDPSFARWVCGVVRFDLDETNAQVPRDDEAMDVGWFTRQQIAAMTATGEIVSGGTLSAIALGMLDDLR